MYVEEGDTLSDVTFYMRERDDRDIFSDNPFRWNVQRASDLFAGKKVLVFGLPGAFTPTCTNSQLPGFEKLYDSFMNAGIDEVYCTSVNDAFTMYQWAEKLGIKKVVMLPDGNGDFARSLGMLVDKSNLGFGERSWRYAMVVTNMEVDQMWVEPGFMDNCPLDPYGQTDPELVLSTLH